MLLLKLLQITGEKGPLSKTLGNLYKTFIEFSTGKVENAEDVFEITYNNSSPFIENISRISSLIGGIGALFYISYRVWKHLANGEPIAIFPLLRPFVIGFCIIWFVPIVKIINGILYQFIVVSELPVLENPKVAIKPNNLSGNWDPNDKKLPVPDIVKDYARKIADGITQPPTGLYEKIFPDNKDNFGTKIASGLLGSYWGFSFKRMLEWQKIRTEVLKNSGSAISDEDEIKAIILQKMEEGYYKNITKSIIENTPKREFLEKKRDEIEKRLKSIARNIEKTEIAPIPWCDPDDYKWYQVGKKIECAAKNLLRSIVHAILKLIILFLNLYRFLALVILFGIGPLAFGLSIFDGFQNSLKSWVTRYVNIYLWLPIANFMFSILTIISASVEAEFGGNFWYMALYGIMCIFVFFKVPQITSWIVSPGMEDSGGFMGSAIGGAVGGIAGGVGKAAGAAKSKAGSLISKGASLLKSSKKE